jgi:hypothetical protein
MDTELLKKIATESLWYIGFSQIIVWVFLGVQYRKYRKRKIGKRQIDPESKKLWEQVQSKRKHIKY